MRRLISRLTILFASFGMIACSATDPNLTMLSVVSLFSADNTKVNTLSLSSVPVSGKCLPSVSKIEVYQGGAWVDLSSAVGVTSLVSCSSSKTFTLNVDLSNPAWAVAGNTFSLQLKAIAGSRSESKSVEIRKIVNNSPGMNVGGGFQQSSGFKIKLRPHSAQASNGGFKFQMRLK